MGCEWLYVVVTTVESVTDHGAVSQPSVRGGATGPRQCDADHAPGAQVALRLAGVAR